MDYVAEGAGDGLLVGGGGVLDKGDGCIGGLAGLDEAISDGGEVAQAHKNDDGVGAVGEGVPVYGGTSLFRVLVAGDDDYGGREVSVGNGDSGVGGGGNG